MDEALQLGWPMNEQDRRISEAIARDEPRLRRFIRRRVADEQDAQDILQDVFYEFVQAYRLMQPIERAGAWLFRVARNRIIDLYRKRKHESLAEDTSITDEGEPLRLEDLLPSPDAGPDAQFARNLLLEELEDALEELPEQEREVFVATEMEGRSFKELAAETGIRMNTLLSRKHYAVLHLRERLQWVHDEFSRK